MNNFSIAAGMAAAATLAWPAMAGARPSDSGTGHYEWQTVPQFGPRASLPIRRQVWVPDRPEPARCQCETMNAAASGCTGAKSGTPSASPPK